MNSRIQPYRHCGKARARNWNGFLAPPVFLSDDTLNPISLKLFSFVGNIASGTPRWNLFAAGSLCEG